MSENFLKMLKELIVAFLLFGGAYYLKIAEDKEPYASKRLRKILVIVGVITVIVSVIKYFANL